MTPDVNVLVAASRADHPHHVVARRWLETALDAAEGGMLVLLPTVATGFLRLVTHPKVFVEPTPLPAAQAFLNAIIETPGVTMLPLGDEWAAFDALCRRDGYTGNDIPDAWIAAAVQTRHQHLVTFDKGFRRMLKPSQMTLLQA
jgi:toxin-antitoxin system PIN domain toxin